MQNIIKHFSLICGKLFDCICNLAMFLKQIYDTSVGILSDI